MRINYTSQKVNTHILEVHILSDYTNISKI